MSQKRIPKRVSTALINSLTAGVVPRIGLEHVMAGRKLEVEALLLDLENTADGGAAFRLITGRYGSGKSFMLQAIRNYAMDRNFVVADADLTPERRLTGTQGQGLATYRELMVNLTTRTCPDGSALETILQKWIASLQQKILKNTTEGLSDDRLSQEVEQLIMAETGELENMVHGFDFARAIVTYWRGYKALDEDMQQTALRWLRGEFFTKTEAKKALNVQSFIDDASWYDYMKLWAEFVSHIGYNGLVLFIDEGVNLYKISHSVARNANYEKVLSMFNDTMQGKASHLAIFMGGTPQFVEDERRGLYSYEALRSRLTAGRFSAGGFRNLAAPIIKLEMLSKEEILVLLQNLRTLFSIHYRYESPITDEHLVEFMRSAVERLGAETLLTPREIIRDFMDIQNVLRQNPEASFEQLMNEHHSQAVASDPDDFDDIDSLVAEFEL